jgi:hypothetical protein
MVLSRIVCITRQITSRRIEYSEFIPLALTLTQFTISQVLPFAVLQITSLVVISVHSVTMDFTRS